MFTLANKTVFITGIGSGIGLCAAQSAIKLGASVYGTVFSDEQRETVKKFLPAECIYKVDITNSEEITAAVDKAASHKGRLDGMVAVAGILSLQTSTQTDEMSWHKTINTNLSGAFYVAKAAIPYLKKQPVGSIVFVSSQIDLTHRQTLMRLKSRYQWLTKSIALELASQSIRVNAVAPGPVE